MNMKYAFAAAAMAASMAFAAPATAQPYSGWNSTQFWSGAPSDAWSRMDYLQQRIDRGRQDGSLTPREAMRAQNELRTLRRQAWQMRRRDGGRMNAADDAWLQTRLDTLSRDLRWARHNGAGYGDNGGMDRFRTDYDARRYYRDGPQYSERRLTAEDEVYRGSDGRYYCKRNDGTTGLIVGGAAGGVLGNVIDGGHNRLAGTLIGGALGALVGKSIDQNSDVRCR
jgi:hypothetical protein